MRLLACQITPLLVVACALGGSVADAEEAKTSEAPLRTYYVSPNGNDAWSGTVTTPNEAGTDGPFASLPTAVSATRKLGTAEPRRIVLAAGTYLQPETLVLTEADSGLTIEGAQDGKAVVCGGRRVTNWAKDGEHFYAATLDGVTSGEWDFRALVVNGQLRPRARLPETGTLKHQSEFNVRRKVGFCCWHRDPTPEELTTMIYAPGDLGEWLEIKNAELTIYHMWDVSVVGISKLDPATRTLTFSKPADNPPGAFKVKKYVVWNVREGMTKPGQWYLDRAAGKLVYWPLPGEEIDKLEVIAPATDMVVFIRGKKEAPATNITIRNLAFSATTVPLQSPGFGANRYQGAVTLADTKNCSLEDLEVFSTGGTGLRERRGAGLAIRRCHVHNTGGTGIKVNGMGSTVTDCYVHHVGVLHPGAIGIGASGEECVVSYNDVHDTTYSGINLGGKRANRVEFNRVHRAMTVMHDGGGIYMSNAKGNVVRGNLVYDVVTQPGGYPAWAIYIDQYADDTIVENNVTFGCSAMFFFHIVKRGIARNNVFISDDAKLSFVESEDCTFERNIIASAGAIALREPQCAPVFRNNVLSSAAGKIVAKHKEKGKKMQVSPLELVDGNVAAPAGTIEFRDDELILAKDTPALKAGFIPFAPRFAGRRNHNAQR